MNNPSLIQGEKKVELIVLFLHEINYLFLAYAFPFYFHIAANNPNFRKKNIDS